ncbi:MAG TPA: hypothetical protein VGN13_12210 [Solirubrobacteraceae bacterium]
MSKLKGKPKVVLAAVVAACIWVAVWTLAVISTGTRGLAVMAVIHAALLFCYCVAYVMDGLL